MRSMLLIFSVVLAPGFVQAQTQPQAWLITFELANGTKAPGARIFETEAACKGNGDYFVALNGRSKPAAIPSMDRRIVKYECINLGE